MNHNTKKSVSRFVINITKKGSIYYFSGTRKLTEVKLIVCIMFNGLSIF